MLTALIDSSSSHCFLESSHARKHKIKTYPIGPLPLTLFNSTMNTYITEAVDLVICLPTGEELSVTFYVTSLDLTCTIILGHNWLTHYNPTIDWVLSIITFPKVTHPQNTRTSSNTAHSEVVISEVENCNNLASRTPEPEHPKSENTHTSPTVIPNPNISVIGTAAFTHIRKRERKFGSISN